MPQSSVMKLYSHLKCIEDDFLIVFCRLENQLVFWECIFNHFVSLWSFSLYVFLTWPTYCSQKNRVSRLRADLWEDALSTNKTVHGKMHGLIGTGVRGNCIIFISRLITKQVLQLVLFFSLKFWRHKENDMNII